MKFKVPIENYLLLDTKFNQHVEFNSLCLSRVSLLKFLGNSTLEKLKSIAEGYEYITTQNQHVKRRIIKLEEENKSVNQLKIIDVSSLEIDRNTGDNKWENLEEKDVSKGKSQK
ncbi:hypothetical protein JHD48_10270 [Sulfurimonas sp. SAG-AH-194-I05]|nr:hypothetical protein [Sulfurimonas sp. SAG-AH-194-I05]